MNKQYKFFYSVILLLNDILMLGVSFYLAVAFRKNFWPVKQNMEFRTYLYYDIFYLIVFIFILSYFILRLYRMESEKYFYIDMGKIFTANCLGAFTLMVMSFMLKTGWQYSRFILVFLVVLNTVLSILSRKALRYFVYRNSTRLINRKNILIIGAGKLGRAYYERITRYENWGNHVIGFVDDVACRDGVKQDELCIGTIGDMAVIHQKYHVDKVIVALPTEEYPVLKDIVDYCDKEGIRVNIIPGYFEYLAVSTTVEELDGLPILNIREVPLDSIINRFIKRSFDVVLSLVAIILLSPALLAVSIGVKLSSSGPIFFKQERIGVNNKKFMMLKFRSMRVQKAEEEKVQWTTKDDPRKTKFGTFIRKTSLDELPQFFNVLMGHMSIVGPRPERPYWVSRFKEEIPDYMLRHYIKSGITGWAQVNGYRGDTSIEERIKYDNYYIHNWSIWLDIKILFMTVIKGFANQNAY